MIYKAYDIGEKISPREVLSEKQIGNIELVVSAVLKNIETNKILYQVPNEHRHTGEHPVIHYNQIVFKNEKITDEEVITELDYLANKLLVEEQVTDKNGSIRRNKNIKEGLLFVRHKSTQLLLLKFEDTQIIDKETFEPIEGFSMDRQYYKIALLNKNSYTDIIIVDRNKSIAKYWALGFLKLERQRDNFVNTTDLIDSLEKNNLISSKIGLSEEDHNSLKRQIRNYMFENTTFDKENLFSALKYDSSKYSINSEELFNPEIFKLIDSEFSFSKDAIIKQYKKSISISETVKVTIENFNDEVNSETIDVKGGNLILKIDTDSLGKVKAMIAEAKYE